MQEPNQNPDVAQVFGVEFRLIVKLLLILGGIIVLWALVCNIPEVIESAQPDPTPVPEPTYTPAPTWTPVPPATATPAPLADLPNQQRHYNEYRLYHFMTEYQLCYREYVDEPTPVPTPVPVPTETAEGAAEAPPEPTPTPTPVPVDDVSLAFHSAPQYGLSDLDLEAHIIRDLPGATRWLIERYQDGSCPEPRQFAIFPGRLTWLDGYAGGG